MKKFLLVVLALWSFAGLAREKEVAQIQIQGLEKFSDQNLSVFYVAGRPAGFGTVGHILHTFKIWNKVNRLRIDENGKVSVPSVKVVNTHGVAFNYLIFVIHDKNQQNVRFMNTDGTCPAQSDINSFSSKEEFCKGINPRDFNYKMQTYRSIRSLKPSDKGIIHLKL
ncbi:MAG: hypothetical protein KC493_12405 [Bacteriovoracaceae bacterium]|nr:hypothetical protein [Bacteriovoracaceae bacterium]